MADGVRGYIAFQGGLNVAKKMGSKSTYLKGEIGGYKGRKLHEGDVIKLNREVIGGEYRESIFPLNIYPNIRGM